MNMLRMAQMIHLAHYENGKGGKALKICKYYKSDYVTIEMLKTFFLTTVAYVLILILLAAGNINWLLDHVDQMNLTVTGAAILIGYIVLMAVYLAVTFLLANMRYNKAKRSVRSYEMRLRELRRSTIKQEHEKAERRRSRT